MEDTDAVVLQEAHEPLRPAEHIQRVCADLIDQCKRLHTLPQSCIRTAVEHVAGRLTEHTC